MTWCPVASSRDLRGKPLAVRVADEEIVLFRDRSGTAFAFEDRCPHRRVPLSLGTVTSEGRLQCGYHGWTYEGGTGRCTAIPNFRPDEPISARVVVRTYPVKEEQGRIFVQVGASATLAAAS